MRSLSLLALVALATVSACKEGGDACRRLCDEQEACGGQPSDDCYDDYSLLLAVPTTRPLQLATCNDALDSLDCSTTDSDTN